MTGLDGEDSAQLSSIYVGWPSSKPRAVDCHLSSDQGEMPLEKARFRRGLRHEKSTAMVPQETIFPQRIVHPRREDKY